MTTQDLVEKIKRYPIPTTCGLIVLVCFFAYYLRTTLIDDLDVERGDIQRQAQQVDQNLQHGRTLAEHITQMKEKETVFDTRVIKSGELATNLRYFYEIEANTRVAIADLKQTVNPPARGAPRTILVPIDYSVLITGRFHDVLGYINELEKGRHFYRLKTFNLQRGRDDSGERAAGTAGPVTLSLNLELLGWP